MLPVTIGAAGHHTGQNPFQNIPVNEGRLFSTALIESATASWQLNFLY